MENCKWRTVELIFNLNLNFKTDKIWPSEKTKSKKFY